MHHPKKKNTYYKKRFMNNHKSFFHIFYWEVNKMNYIIITILLFTILLALHTTIANFNRK